MLPEFMMFITANINMDHTQFALLFESIFGTLSILKEKYIFKCNWVETVDLRYI